MRRARRGKCLCCGELFRADPRNRRRQKYCEKGACRVASKAASQRRWLEKPENQRYFSGPLHVARVRAWRAVHPGYWRRPGAGTADALQDPSRGQVTEPAADSRSLALQDLCRSQSAVLIGLIAHLTDSPLQEDILATSRRLLQLGQDILGGGQRAHADQTPVMPAAPAAHSASVQLDRPAPGA
jgi:hypothetical protein